VRQSFSDVRVCGLSEVRVRKFRTLKTLWSRTRTRVCLFTHLYCKEVNISQKISEISIFSFLKSYSLCRLALFTLCCGALWWLKRRPPVSAPLVASRPNGRRRATLSQKFQKNTPIHYIRLFKNTFNFFCVYRTAFWLVLLDVSRISLQTILIHN
jgi:hypothetical protein